MPEPTYPTPATHGPDAGTVIRHRRLTIRRTDTGYMARHDDGRSWARPTLAACLVLDTEPATPRPDAERSPFRRLCRATRPRTHA